MCAPLKVVDFLILLFLTAFGLGLTCLLLCGEVFPVRFGMKLKSGTSRQFLQHTYVVMHSKIIRLLKVFKDIFYWPTATGHIVHKYKKDHK